MGGRQAAGPVAGVAGSMLGLEAGGQGTMRRKAVREWPAEHGPAGRQDQRSLAQPLKEPTLSRVISFESIKVTCCAGLVPFIRS